MRLLEISTGFSVRWFGSGDLLEGLLEVESTGKCAYDCEDGFVFKWVIGAIFVGYVNRV